MTAGEYYAAQMGVLADIEGVLDEYLAAMDMLVPGISEGVGGLIRKTVYSLFADLFQQLTSPLRICGAATELDYDQGVPA